MHFPATFSVASVSAGIAEISSSVAIFPCLSKRDIVLPLAVQLSVTASLGGVGKLREMGDKGERLDGGKRF